jgi:hypothetical protein
MDKAKQAAEDLIARATLHLRHGKIKDAVTCLDMAQAILYKMAKADEVPS